MKSAHLVCFNRKLKFWSDLKIFAFKTYEFTINNVRYVKFENL